MLPPAGTAKIAAWKKLRVDHRIVFVTKGARGQKKRATAEQAVRSNM